MAPLQALKTYYANVTRVPFGQIGQTDGVTLANLAAQVDAGTTTFAAAAVATERLAIGSVSVGELTYQFFTGATPYLGGLDFLAKPDGPNPNNLNAGYYSTFNVGNRYINLAVSLGSAGEGKAGFTAAYGAGTLEDAATKAYTAIFGFAPAAGKIQQILSDPAPDGKGGTYTRADYFAELGGSPRDGLGAKAAVVGYFLGEAAKADIGPYATALDAFLADLAPDGIAKNHVNLLDTYGPAPAAVAGATIAFDHNQSVAPDAANASLRSTTGDDTISGPAGLDVGQSVSASAGRDVITVSGTVSGMIDGGDGRDAITVDTLNYQTTSVATLGSPSVTGAGTIRGGAGDDVITVAFANSGSIIDGGAGDDTLILKGNLGDTFPAQAQISNIEHIALRGPYFDIQNPGGGPGNPPPIVGATFYDMSGVVGLQDITDDSPGQGIVSVKGVAADVTLIQRNTAAGLSATFRSATNVDLHLDGVRTGLDDNAPSNSNFVSIQGASGTLRLHADSDSALVSLGYSGSNVTIDGLGKLTAQITLGTNPTTGTIDASASAGVVLSTAYGASVILSPFDDTLTLDLSTAAPSSVTLGAGTDTLNASANTNLLISGSSVAGFLTVTDFSKGQDHLNLPASVVGVTLASPGSATTLEQALISVSPQVASGGYARFEFKGDTYIYHQDATVGANTGDGLIRLVGVTGISVVTGAASGDIHYG